MTVVEGCSWSQANVWSNSFIQQYQCLFYDLVEVATTKIIKSNNMLSYVKHACLYCTESGKILAVLFVVICIFKDKGLRLSDSISSYI